MATPDYFRPNSVYCGDCLEVLKRFPDESADLIYADPPFFSNRHYEVIWDDGYELRAFEDRWKGGINNYVEWMVERLKQCQRVLKKSGSIFLHCDWHASHYLKVEMDRIFGDARFRNEIVWKRSDAHSDARQGAKHFGRVHDTILFYTKSDDYTFNSIYKPLPETTVEKWYRHVEEGTGRRYNLDNLTGPGGASKGNPYYEFRGVKGFWRYSKANMEKLNKEGRIVKTKTGKLYYKRYLDESKGVPVQDWWDDISKLRGFSSSKENLGYPTQKPEALLERIVSVASNPADIVLDPFCGCGTALAVSQRLGRRWVGIDVSPTACDLMEKRLRKMRASPFVVGMPMTEEELRKLKPFDFQNWVVKRLFGRVSDRLSGDMGIDGLTFEGHPIQVKQYETGRQDIDAFETAMKRKNAKVGIFVAFGFSKGAFEEIARFKREEGLEIQPKTVAELLGLDKFKEGSH